MASMQLADNPTGSQIQGREQARRAVPLVVMGASLRYSRRQRQQRLGPIQGLNLALLVHAQHHRFGGRIQIQPNDVAHLVDEQRIGGELEGLNPMRLQPEGAPSAANRALRYPQLGGQQPRTPMARLAWPLIERGRDQLLDSRVIEFAWRPGRGSSSSPSRRCSKNRRRHLPTVCRVTRQRWPPRCCPPLARTRAQCANATPKLARSYVAASTRPTGCTLAWSTSTQQAAVPCSSFLPCR